ncbi:hypothetical protein [Nocardioides sp. 616]|uniref:hypothetical protein n=1 Tax=Nocardioides sp. 616 TaxID=2268090 RepID=UPI0013B38D34|nr:hypothetical protein [Nocardioides sp. 616]
MDRESLARRDRTLPWLLGWLTLLAVGCVLAALTSNVLPLVLAALAACVSAYAGALGWRLSTAVVLAGSLVGQVLLGYVSASVGWDIGADNLIAWTVVGAGHAVIAARTRPDLSRRQLFDLGAVLLTPAVIGFYFLWTALTSPHPWLTWAMVGDSANNMILNRQFVRQGGLILEQGNPAPLATVVHGSWGAVGLDGLNASDTVRQLVLSAGQLGLLLFMAVSVLASLLALASARPGGQRVLVAAVAGLIPWLWFGAGYTFAYGFQNVAPALLLLLVAWMCWCAQVHHPVAAVTGLVLSTWACGTAWGPVAAVPALWLLVAALRQRKGLRASGRLVLVPVLTFAAAVAYAVFITLPDLQSAGGLPSFDGASPVYDAKRSLWIGIGAAVLVLVLHRWLDPQLRWGFWTAAPAIGLGVAQLMLAREGMPTLWGYYPIKFTWILMTVGVIVLFAALVSPFQRLASRAWSGTGVIPALVLSVLVMYLVTPPVRPMTVASVLAPVRMHDDRVNDQALAEMFRLMAQHPKTILAGYSPTDGMYNFWLMQSSAKDLNASIRQFAYVLDPADWEAVCAAAKVWGEGTRVLTRDRTFAKTMRTYCEAPEGLEITLVKG